MFKPKLQTVLLACIVALVCATPVKGLASSSYDAIIALARTGAHSQAIEALRAWQTSNPQDKRVDSDLIVIMGWAGLDADALAVAKASGSNALEPYALRSAAKSARNQQDPVWALEAYKLLLAKDPQDCDALLGTANSQVDLRAPDEAGSTLTQLEKTCADAQDWPLRIAQARTYWSARQTNSNAPKDIAALACGPCKWNHCNKTLTLWPIAMHACAKPCWWHRGQVRINWQTHGLHAQKPR